MAVGWRPSLDALAGGAQGAFRGVGRQLDVMGLHVNDGHGHPDVAAR